MGALLVRVDPASRVQAFLDRVLGLYGDLGTSAATMFDPGKATALPTQIKGTESFKVLTECPLIVLLLFQVRQAHTRSAPPSSSMRSSSHRACRLSCENFSPAHAPVTSLPPASCTLTSSATSRLRRGRRREEAAAATFLASCRS